MARQRSTSNRLSGNASKISIAAYPYIGYDGGVSKSTSPTTAKITVIIARDLLARARLKVGTRGLSPLIVQMLEKKFPK